MKKLMLITVLLATRLLGANADVDPNFYIYICFGQSNMEGNAQPESIDKTGIDDIRQVKWTWLRHGDEIILCDVPASTRVALYDLRGMILYQASAIGSEIRIPAAESNLYILKVGNETIKLR